MDKVSVFLLLLLAILLSSCGIYHEYGFRYKQLGSVEQGMALNEVTSVLGKPTFRDFNGEGETLTFRALGTTGWSVVKVKFKEGKVTEMKSYLENDFLLSPPRTTRAVSEKKVSSNDESSSKIIVSSDGKHYIKMGSIIVTPEGKHIIIH
ncbi:hypothetical protein [Bacteroides sp.]|uniref:hypothetical protein n=1 Tax=Bacteroides sp. TaxID=29523 RepID=UPI00260620A8|nr:hypothetical protein [Bacteroides sp.]